MKSNILAAAVSAGILCLGTLTLAAQDDPKKAAIHGASDRMTHEIPLSEDGQWIVKAAQGGMAEVELGNLAKDHAASDAVKAFGQHMVDDHSKANDELKGLAAQKNVTLPSAVDAKDRAVIDRLSKLNGAAFDRAYIKDMVADHKKDIAEFQKEANSGNDQEVKAWAAKTLPTLQNHLTMALDAQKQLKKK